MSLFKILNKLPFMNSHLLAGTFLNFNYSQQCSHCPLDPHNILIKTWAEYQRELCSPDTLINHADKTSMNLAMVIRGCDDIT